VALRRNEKPPPKLTAYEKKSITLIGYIANIGNEFVIIY
jgi:hypothetical protein